MSKTSTASSSSSTPDASTAWKDSAELAELIVSTFERAAARNNDPDLLTRWIAHQLAEVIVLAEKARSAPARQEALITATDLVTRLWSHRSDWPDGWPPESARQRIAQLMPQTARWEPGADPTGSAWIDRLAELDQLSLAEMRLWWQVGLLETGVEAQREALAVLSENDEEPDDVRWLRTEVRLHDEARAWATKHKARSRKAVRELACSTLREIEQRRAELVAEVAASPIPRRRRASSPR